MSSPPVSDAPIVQIAPKFLPLFNVPLGTVRFRVFYGGRGGAKTTHAARALLVHAMRGRLRILCCREFQNTIRESVHDVLSAEIAALGFAAFFSIQETVITCKTTGSEFLFKGLRRNPAEVKGINNIGIAWVEEAQRVSERSWQVLLPTVRAEGSEIWVTFNPDEPDDPTYKRFVMTRPAQKSIVVKVGHQDNPWLSETLKQQERADFAADPESHAHIWGGEPVTRSKAQILRDKIRVREFTPGADWKGPYFGADFGFSHDPTTLTKCWVHDSRLYVEYETGGVQWDNDQINREFRLIPDAANYTIRADSARPETINELRKRGLLVEPCEKWSGSVEDGIAHLRTYSEIVVHPRCVGTIEESRLYRYKVDDADQVTRKIVDAHNHYWDSIRYGIGPLIRPPKRVGVYSV